MSKTVLLSQISGDDSGPPTWLDQQELQRLIIENNPKIQCIAGISTRSELFSKSALRMQIQVKLAGKQNDDDCNFDISTLTIS